MELTAFNQTGIMSISGNVYNNGEDALPYVDNQLFFVADGCGGKSGFPHTKFNFDMFDKDKLLDTLFNDIYSEYSNETFERYVIESFCELLNLKGVYGEKYEYISEKDGRKISAKKLKNSGYFGSRIAAAILLHEMFYNEKAKPSYLFKQYNLQDTQEKKDHKLKEFGDFFARRIGEDIRKIAQKVNLVIEVPIPKIELLGTTLCATIYQENEQFVDTLYLTAGDSRPYVWTEGDGLCQIVEDQNNGAVLSNNIRANDDKAFDIRCDYFKFKKPCVLFNASDGFIISDFALGFEKTILEKVIESNNTDELSKALSFKSKSDDSGTVAMKFFGYDSFDAFKGSAKNRLKSIEEDYIKKMPDLLGDDYMQTYQKCSAELTPALSNLKTSFEKEEVVKVFYVAQMKNSKYAAFEEKILGIEKQTTEQRQEIKEASKQIKDIIANNFIRFVELLPCQEKWLKKIIQIIKNPVYRTQSKIKKIEEEHKKQAEIYEVTIKQCLEDLGNATKCLLFEKERIVKSGVPCCNVDVSVIRECNTFIISLNKFYLKLKNIKDHIIELQKKYKENNKKLAYKDLDKLQAICCEIISGEDLEGSIQSKLVPGDFERLQQYHGQIKEARNKIYLLDKDERKKVEEECGKDYWEKNWKDLISLIVSNADIKISDDLRTEAKTVIEEKNKQSEELKSKADQQEKLFKQYDIKYSQYLRGDN